MKQNRTDVYINGDLKESVSRREPVDVRIPGSGKNSRYTLAKKALRRTGIILGGLGVLFGIAGVVTAVVLGFNQNRNSLYYNAQDGTVNSTVNNEILIRNVRELSNGDFALKTELEPIVLMITSANAGLAVTTSNLRDNYYNRNNLYTKTEADGRFFLSTGGQVTGPVSSTLTTFQNNEFVTKQYTDSAVLGLWPRDGTSTATGILSYESDLVFTGDRNIVDKRYADTKLDLGGGTVIGAIKGINPVDNTDLTTKQYVDVQRRTSNYSFSIDNATLDAQTNPSTPGTTAKTTINVKPNTIGYIEEFGTTEIYDLNKLQDDVASFRITPTFRNVSAPNPATQVPLTVAISRPTLEFIRQANGSFAMIVNGAQVPTWSVTSFDVLRQYSLSFSNGGTQVSRYQAVNFVTITLSVSNGRILLTKAYFSQFNIIPRRLINTNPLSSGLSPPLNALLVFKDWEDSSRLAAVNFTSDSLEVSLLKASSQSNINIPDPAANTDTRANLSTELIDANFSAVENGLINLPEGYSTTVKVNTNFVSSSTADSSVIVELVGIDNAGGETVLSSQTVETSDITNTELALTVKGSFLRTTDANISPYSAIRLRYRTYGGDVNLEGADVSIIYAKA